MWQPIETAPTDGTPILISDGDYVEKAKWLEYAPVHASHRKGGWRVYECEDETYPYAITDVVWWMPVPLPPE